MVFLGFPLSYWSLFLNQIFYFFLTLHFHPLCSHTAIEGKRYSVGSFNLISDFFALNLQKLSAKIFLGHAFHDEIEKLFYFGLSWIFLNFSPFRNYYADGLWEEEVEVKLRFGVE